MTRDRRIIAAAVRRLRDYLAAGGRPYLTACGKLSVAQLAPGHWRTGTAAQQAERERAVQAFHDAAAHDLARQIIARAIRMAGTRRRLGVIDMGMA